METMPWKKRRHVVYQSKREKKIKQSGVHIYVVRFWWFGLWKETFLVVKTVRHFPEKGFKIDRSTLPAMVVLPINQKLSERKNLSKTFSTCKGVCTNVFECARMFFGWNRSNSCVCLRSVKFFRVCAQCRQQTNSLMFSTGTFVWALPKSFVWARSPPNVLIPY